MSVLDMILAAIVAFSFCCTFAVTAAERQIGRTEDLYVKRQVMIPMRDGARLYTAVYEPKHRREGGSPIIMLRTPYSVSPYSGKFCKDLDNYLYKFVENGYVIVFQSVRGTYLSEGEYENIRPLNTTPANGIPDDATDTYDTVEWLLANTHNNGSVGVKGISYPGYYATIAGLAAHPAIRAISPQAPVTDWFIGDDTYHNGALMLSIYSFGSSFFKARPEPTTKYNPSSLVIDKDLYSYFKERMEPETIWKDFGDSLKFFNDMKAHPVYDGFWQERNPMIHARKFTAATMVVGGWYDGEDCYGPFETYRRLKSESRADVYLVAGPWFHGAWKRPGYQNLGDAWFGTGSAEYFIENIEYPFFAYYLEGKGDKPENVYILPSAETSREQMEGKPSDENWKMYAGWPCREARSASLYLSADGSLTTASDDAVQGDVTYISDPENPVPYIAEIGTEWGREYMTADQSWLDTRKDVVSFAGAELEESVFVQGQVGVELDVAIDGTDADIVVKLLDVYPDGKKMLVREDIMPMRYRNGLSEPEPVEPGKVTRISFEMNDVAHIFQPGHRMMVQVQSSCFPLFAMNPQTFHRSPFEVEKDDFRKAEVRIVCGDAGKKSSRIVVNIVK